MGVLSHLRVLDLTHMFAGPWCAQSLVDFGTDVIKVERPGAGNGTRTWGPPWLKDEADNSTAEVAYYLVTNRNKRSITVGISTSEGQDIVRQLTAHADVVLENYKVGQLEKYGLDYTSLKAVKPDPIYCSITGFGQTGPYAPRAGYDFIAQSMGGFMSLTGERDDLPDDNPQKAGMAISDLMTGMYATVAVLVALTRHDRTSEGQYIDMALLDVQATMLANMNTSYLTSGEAPKRWDNAHPSIIPCQTFQAVNGWVIVVVSNDGQFQRFVSAGSMPELADDPCFTTNPQRVANHDVLVPILAEMVKHFGKGEWIDRLGVAGVPCSPINSLDEVFDNEQVQARSLRVGLPYPSTGTVKLVDSSVRISTMPPKVASRPSLLGEHTGAVLRDVPNLSTGQVDPPRRRDVI